MAAPLARRAWLALEPYHAVTYFAPEVRAALDGAGLAGFWMGYFAARAAPLGPVGPAVVDALFYNFHPSMPRRALPDAWARATPAEVLAARDAGVAAALRRVLGDSFDAAEVGEVAPVARRAAEAADCHGRALAAAHQALDWPTEPALALWLAATILREHRGDGHVATLVNEGVGPCEAHVLLVAAARSTAAVQQQARRWSDDDWRAAAASLASRGWLDTDGALTSAGHDAHERIEATTDELAAAPYAAIDAGDLARLLDVAEPLARRVAACGDVPFPNPMGLPPPAPSA